MAEKKEKLTVEKILQQKKIFDKKLNTPYFCQILDCEIDIEEHSISKVSAIINKEYDDPIRADLELIYAFCPIFRSKKLQKELGVEDPIDTVELSLGHNITEINALVKHILARYGLGEDKIQKIKKQ